MALILIVDDEAAVRAALRKTLRHAGHDVVEAANGTEALDKFQAQAADLVVTDIYMPGLTGMELMARIHELSESVKFIVISGGGEYDAAALLSMFDMVGKNVQTLAKPFEHADVVRVIEAALGAPPA